MNKEMNRERHEWDSKQSALQLEVATGKENAKVCSCLLIQKFVVILFN